VATALSPIARLPTPSMDPFRSAASPIFSSIVGRQDAGRPSSSTGLRGRDGSCSFLSGPSSSRSLPLHLEPGIMEEVSSFLQSDSTQRLNGDRFRTEPSPFSAVRGADNHEQLAVPVRRVAPERPPPGGAGPQVPRLRPPVEASEDRQVGLRHGLQDRAAPTRDRRAPRRRRRTATEGHRVRLDAEQGHGVRPPLRAPLLEVQVDTGRGEDKAAHRRAGKGAEGRGRGVQEEEPGVRRGCRRQIPPDGGESDGAGAEEDGRTRGPQVYLDAHVPDLLVLPPSSSSWLNSEDDLVRSGRAVLQVRAIISFGFATLFLADFASPRAMLGAAPGGGPCDYIDACAAPGNKTSHLAALVRQAMNGSEDPGDVKKDKRKKKKSNRKAKSTIYAFERSSARFEILQQRMELLVPKSSASEVAVCPVHGDFLKSDPAEFENVRAILLDPSCSGSGIVNSPDRFADEGDDKGTRRVQSLANFQLTILKHAMSFPNVERIVYSTCSVHDEENEAVVSTALEEHAAQAEEEGVADGDRWTLASPVCLEHWERRGRAVAGLTEEQARCLVRCDGLDGDETNGFFVSLFVRERLVGTGGPRGIIVGSDGVAVYGGEFAPGDPDSNDAGPGEDANEDAAAPPSPGAERKDPPAAEKKNKAARGRDKGPRAKAKDPSKSAKKREKKLAWKRRQARQKEERLLAKRAKGGDA
ncbi:hypothetical protein THAOC_04665, partial [Thalassiosira oceanica]